MFVIVNIRKLSVYIYMFIFYIDAKFHMLSFIGSLVTSVMTIFMSLSKTGVQVVSDEMLLMCLNYPVKYGMVYMFILSSLA
jgi:hypothetical protein